MIKNMESQKTRMRMGLTNCGRLTIALTAAFAGSILAMPRVAAAAERPNVLFIVVDDLNAWVGHLGNRQARTPNIDRLAARGVSFANASAPAPACNPSRAGVMSGLRPAQTGIYENEQDWMAAIPVEQTLTTQFRAAGYDVFGAGKVFHDDIYRDAEWTGHFVPRDEKLPRDPSAHDDGVGGIKFYPLAARTEQMPDFKTVSWSIARLRQHHARPFFLAVGLKKPHMPWAVPKKYFDLFPLASITLPPYLQDDLDDLPAAAGKSSLGLKDHKNMVRSGRWPEAVRAYLASIAFADEQIGRLIDALESSPYRDNTIVVLWGDNGFHLGEKHRWRKFTLWEEGTRVPLVYVAPGIAMAGGVSPRPVDLMSIYPTLCELAGIGVPAHVRDPSLLPLLKNPQAQWNHAGLTTLAKGSSAVRTDRWRYIRYSDGSEELYDHSADPNEWRNLAAVPDLGATKVRLSAWLPSSYATPLPFSRRPFPWLFVGAAVAVAATAAFALRARVK